MKAQQKLFGILFLCLSVFLIAQKTNFLKVPDFNDADLSKEKSLIDPDAPAEVLYRSIHYWIDTSTGLLTKDVIYRIKIYDKENSNSWLDLEIPLYGKNGNNETLYSVKAVVYNLENGKTAVSKVEKSSKYKSKENDLYTINKYAFPNVKNGSIIEYSYTVTSPFLYEIPTVIIELDIPSVYSEYVFDSPVSMAYNIDYSGWLQPDYRAVEEAIIYNGNYRMNRFGYKDVKAFKKEEFVKNADNFRTKIKAELHSTFINNKLEMYSSSWEKISKTLAEDANFGGELRKIRLVKDLIPNEAKTESDLLTKSNIIFDYVKKNYTWNKVNGIYAEKGLKSIIESKIGNVADINFLLIAMLREVGVEANPLLISTVSNGFLNEAIPNATNCNYVIAAVEINGNFYFYDATSKQSMANLLPPRDWNDLGILLKDKTAQKIRLENATMSNSQMEVIAKVNDDGTITGQYIDKDTGLYAMVAKESYDENSEKYVAQYKTNFSLDFEKIKTMMSENGDFVSTMDFKSSNMMDVVGKKIIVNPILFLNKSNNEFNQEEERRFPIDFYTPFTRTKKVELEIPEGYAVENLPKNKKIVTEDREIQYSYKAQTEGNKIIISTSLQVSSANYPKEYYPAFKQIWKTIVDTQNQVVSLVQK